MHTGIFKEKPLNGVSSEYPDHGGDVRLASRLSGVPESRILDFSASINPLGIPPIAAEAYVELKNELSVYPEPESKELKCHLSKDLGLPESWLCVTNGSVELIRLLPQLWPPEKSVAIVEPTFSEYSRAFELAEVPIQKIVLNPDAAFRLSIEQMLQELEAMPQLGGVVIGHPNNPTGALWEEETLLGLLAYCEERRLFLVVDEAFVEFSESGNFFLSRIQNCRYLILVRSMTKIYGLPGLRIGFGILHPDWGGMLMKHQIPWSVNRLAQKLGQVVTGDAKFLEQTRSYIQGQREFLTQGLKNMGFIKVNPSDANFLLFRLRHPSVSPGKFYESLLRKGIVVRNCGNFLGLDDSYFRVAVRKIEENQVLLEGVKDVFLRETN